uniref:C2H2-type domain-containing protein n=1 Tax=Takifugu rubripes TaxID=31033 RepID=A0A674PAN1_TAKRU
MISPVFPELSQQQTLWKEEEDDYQHQDRSCSLDQEDSKPPQIKDEQEETCCYQDGESLTVKQEMDTLMADMAGHSTINPNDTPHVGLRPYLCKTCGKAFLRGHDLIIHSRDHTGERPYLCKICGKTFLRSSDLTIHLRDHTGERPYVCKTCGKAFKVNSSLNKHMRIHSRERPHVCETCGEAFTQSCELVQHMSTHRSENIQICKQESSDIAAASSSQ